MIGSFSASESKLIAHKLTQLRREPLACGDYRQIMRHISVLLAYEATHTLASGNEVTFVVADTGKQASGILLGNDPVIVPILRTGLVMADAFQEVMPQTFTGHIGLHRNKSAVGTKPIEYLVSLPDLRNRLVILLDPVIATGDTAWRALEIVKRHGAKDIRFVSLIISRPAKERFLTKRGEHNDVKFYCAAEDPDVDKETGKLIPGLGSVSHRLFGFKTRVLSGRA